MPIFLLGLLINFASYTELLYSDFYDSCSNKFLRFYVLINVYCSVSAKLSCPFDSSVIKLFLRCGLRSLAIYLLATLINLILSRGKLASVSSAIVDYTT